ncbi:MAG TPA: hypothetical protein VMU06_12905 [Stellaceae bacterium]|nr:hypothetical protein [Stellaceae bacterium]
MNPIGSPAIWPLMRQKTIAALVVLQTFWTTSAAATIVTIDFSAIVDPGVYISGPSDGESWGATVVKAGDLVTGSYSYDYNPTTGLINTTSYQSSFQFSAGAFADSGSQNPQGLAIAIYVAGTLNYSGGDRYRTDSGNDLLISGGRLITSEDFGIDLTATGGGVLPANVWTTPGVGPCCNPPFFSMPPDYTAFQSHEFFYQLYSLYGGVDFTATLTSLTLSEATPVPEPSSLTLVVGALASVGLLNFCWNNRTRRRGQ